MVILSHCYNKLPCSNCSENSKNRKHICGQNNLDYCNISSEVGKLVQPSVRKTSSITQKLKNYSKINPKTQNIAKTCVEKISKSNEKYHQKLASLFSRLKKKFLSPEYFKKFI